MTSPPNPSERADRAHCSRGPRLFQVAFSGVGAQRDIPPDLLAKARQRLGAIALFVAAVGVAGFCTILMRESAWTQLLSITLLDLLAVVVCVGVYVATRGERIPTRRIFPLATALQVFICVLATVKIQLYHSAVGDDLSLITPANIAIVLFSAVIPARPDRLLRASLLAAASIPLCFASLDAFDAIAVQPDDYLWVSVGALFTVVIAQFGAYVVYGINVEVVRARELGSYQLETQLGAGGMGEVWRARHQLLARPAAIKLIRQDAKAATREARLRRFEREAQVTATLRSPHSVELYDFGVTQDGAYFYAMELLDGMDLEKLVARHGPQPAARVVHILAQICHSLAEAHERDLIHRDIKPENIYLCRYGLDCDFVKVLDFGLVTLQPALTASDPRLTHEGVLMGTPAFMAPEIALGQADTADHRVDLYAIGCVAYWLLTGKLVFEGATHYAMIAAHAYEAPTPPSEVLPEGIDQPIPEPLERLVCACLAKDPAERPQTALALRRALLALDVAGQWSDDRAHAWWAEHGPAPDAEAGAEPSAEAEAAAGRATRTETDAEAAGRAAALRTTALSAPAQAQARDPARGEDPARAEEPPAERLGA